MKANLNRKTVAVAPLPMLADDGYFVKSTLIQGKGVYASRDFESGEHILRFEGKKLRSAEISDFTYCLEIGKDLFLGPSGKADDFINHSCDPNCGVIIKSSKAELVAIQTIKKGEQFTYDYSTLILGDPTSFNCHCNSPHCRGKVGGFESLSKVLQDHYISLGIVPGFVLLTR